MKKHFFNLLKLLIMVAIGVVIFKFMNQSPKVAEHSGDQLPAKAVQTLMVSKQPFTANATAYGNIEPAVVFESRAELSAKVSYVHPELKAGGSVAAGTVVVRLETQDVKNSLDQTQADLSASRSALAQLDQERKNTARSLSLAQKNLALGQAELERIRVIYNKQLVAKSTLDAEQQKVLQLEQSVSDLQGQLNTFESRQASARAQINRSSSQVEGQETNLGRTEVVMPFDARISMVGVDAGEFVSVGAALFEAINTDGVEVQAQLPTQSMRELLAAFQGQSINLSADGIDAALKSLNLKAQVRLVEGSDQAIWEGQVMRISESIDPDRRTIGITVAVADPYEGVVLGEKPPLIKGMYVAVDLFAPAFEGIVLPRNAIHQGRVYLANAQDELEIREVHIAANQGDKVLIAGGLQVGERVIVNDVIPVIAGMPVLAVDIANSMQ